MKRKRVKPIDPVEMTRILAAAHALDVYMRENAGPTADWPLSFTVDTPEDGELLSRLLTDFHQALAPFRRVIRYRTRRPTAAQLMR